MVKFVEICIFAVILAAAYAAPGDGACDKRKCKGPIKYYEDLSCKPIYENEGDCCASAYNCDHLITRSKDKCYFRGKEYQSGERLTERLSDPCTGSCTCSVTNYDARFICTMASCVVDYSMTDGLVCYNPMNATNCCPEKSVCIKPEDVPTCEVDGKIYTAGDMFIPVGEPYKRCYCNRGYKGENVAPFCRTLNERCETEIRYSDEIANNNPPIYSSDRSTQTECPRMFRYQNTDDRVIKPNGAAVVASENKSDSQDRRCKFGNLTLARGEKLSRGISWNSAPVECECQVPPALTCIELPSTLPLE